MADRIAVMRAGRIEQVASPHDLFAKPANVFVAGFIGTPQMNLVEAILQSAGEPVGEGRVNATFQLLGQSFAASVNAGIGKIAANSKVTLGVRPRSFEFAEAGLAGALRASVDLIEPMGAEVLAHLVEEKTDLRCVVPHTTRLSVGQRVHVRCKPGQLHVFGVDGKLVE